jgi:high affinity Mn2+ porin
LFTVISYNQKIATLIFLTALGLNLPGMAAAVLAAPPMPAPEDPAAPQADAAAGDATPESWAIHGQATNIWQYHPGFNSGNVQGRNSLESGSSDAETLSVTLFAGVRLWAGAEAWVEPEVDQGFGLSGTFGIAGFPNGEAYQIPNRAPYLRVPPLFIRQTINLGGETEKVEPDLNVLGGTQSANRVVVTVGKFSVADVFDRNAYAHDPRNDFLNWTIIDAGAFDYVADDWGYTIGGSVEWYQDWWTIRTGLFDQTLGPDSKYGNLPLGTQSQAIVELEARYDLFAQPGIARFLVYGTRARMASYYDAIALGVALGEPATPDGVRRLRNKGGLVLNVEQQLATDLGVFARAGQQDPGILANAFTDVSQSVSVGASMTGSRWGRPDDTVGVAGVINLASRPLRDYLAAGGLGLVVGDGVLRNSGPEQIAEAFYSFSVTKGLYIGADYQFVVNPGYNRDRGPVSIIGARLHGEF